VSLSTTHPFDNVTQEFSSIITVMRVKRGKIWDAGWWYARMAVVITCEEGEKKNICTGPGLVYWNKFYKKKL
jgi:hypothetical protein